MASATSTRRLTSIVAADVAGYSRLIAADEEIFLEALHAHRLELIDPKITEYRGRIANTAGDSLLIEFPIIVDALRFAIDMQRGIAERNTDIAEDRRIVFHIGINLGDVIEQDGDLLGDGVNVAARLEGIAEVGGINISAAAFDQVKDRVDVGYQDIGNQSLKNIPLPVHVYRVRLDGTGMLKSRRPKARQIQFAAMFIVFVVIGSGLWWIQSRGNHGDPVQPVNTPTAQSERRSIAVLPFDNMSNDIDQECFSDGMTEDLITDLAKVSDLYVIARNSTFAYKGKATDIRTIAKELEARYVIEGSVRKVNGRVRINAQLIDAETGNHLWADRYDREYKDVFVLQDEVLGKIVKALRVTLTPKEQRRVAYHDTENPEAYDWFLKGLQQESFFSKEGNRESRRLFERAIELDPTYASAYAHLAQGYSLAHENKWTDAQK